MARKKSTGLGKGLDSLIPDYYNEDFDTNNSVSLEDMLNEDKTIDDVVEDASAIEKEVEEVVSEDVEDDTSNEEDLDSTVEQDVDVSTDDDVDSTVEQDEDSPLDEPIEESSNIDTAISDSKTKDVEEELEIEEDISTIENEDNSIEEDIVEDEIKLSERELANIEEVKGIVAKNPRITLWSAQSAAVFRCLIITEPELSSIKEASLMIEEAVSKKYPEIWKLFEED